jgi:hypothetical protein
MAYKWAIFTRLAVFENVGTECPTVRNNEIITVMALSIRSRKPKLTAVGIRCADYATPSIR